MKSSIFGPRNPLEMGMFKSRLSSGGHRVATDQDTRVLHTLRIYLRAPRGRILQRVLINILWGGLLFTPGWTILENSKSEGDFPI